MRFGPIDINFGIFLRGLGKKGLFLMGWGGGGTVFALLNLFFLRGIVNSPHPKGLWLLNGLCKCGKKLIFFQFIVGKMAVY